MGHDWRIALQVIITVVIQLIMAYAVQELPWKLVWLFTYVISGTLNHSLSISFHESMISMFDKQFQRLDYCLISILVGHNLAFGNHRPIANRILGYVANLPLCIPSSVTFKKYHIDHHKSVEYVDLSR
jgi:sphingolipid 4-desaturase/C4-monooxygenase